MPKRKKRDKDITDAYRLNNPLCELFDVLEGRKWDSILASYKKGRRVCREDFLVEVHHIWGGPHRWDIDSNIISVSRPAHDYCHKFPDHGRIACLWVKADKGELDRDLMRECMGFDTIGILESFEVTEEWVENLRLGLYERFSSYE
jgi:hypothetical protein